MPLTKASALRMVPLNRLLTLGGKKYDSRYLHPPVPDGDGSYDLLSNVRYGLAATYTGALIDPDGFPVWDIASQSFKVEASRYPFDEEPTRYGYQGAEVDFISAPPYAVKFPSFCDELVQDEWKFYSANGIDAYSPGGIPTTRSGWITPPVYRYYGGNDVGWIGDFDWNDNLYEPTTQHALLCDMTETYRDPTGPGPIQSIGNYAIYSAVEASITANDMVSYLNAGGDQVIVLAVDGTGSFGGGSPAFEYIEDFLTTFGSSWPGNSVTFIVTKFSDYGEYLESDGQGDIPAYFCGSWNGINQSIFTEVRNSLNFDTGNGGDSNETQFEAIYYGMQKAKELGKTGRKAVLVYTDAAGVVSFPGRVGVLKVKTAGALTGADDVWERA